MIAPLANWSVVARQHLYLTATAALAWLWLLLQGAGWLPPALCLSPTASAPSRYWTEWAAFVASPMFAGTLGAWLLMFAAMMLPLLATPLAQIRQQSFPRRRIEAQLLFGTGYALVWAIAFAAMLAALVATRSAALGHSSLIAPCLFLLAAWWQGTRSKRRALIACHRPGSLSAFGWRASRDHLMFGATHGAACVASCGFIMAAMLFGHHFLLGMIGGAAIVFVERYRARPPIRMTQVLLVLLALLTLTSSLSATS